MKIADKPIGFRPMTADEKRISREEASIRTAGIWALRSTCLRKKVGAVITVDGRIVATGYAGSSAGTPHCLDEGCIIDPVTGGCIRTQHAERNAIRDAFERGIDMTGAVMYCTLSPCQACAQLIINHKFSSVVYYHEYRDRAGLDLLMTQAEKIDCWKFPDTFNLLLADLEDLK